MTEAGPGAAHTARSTTEAAGIEAFADAEPARRCAVATACARFHAVAPPGIGGLA